MTTIDDLILDLECPLYQEMAVAEFLCPGTLAWADDPEEIRDQRLAIRRHLDPASHSLLDLNLFASLLLVKKNRAGLETLLSSLEIAALFPLPLADYLAWEWRSVAVPVVRENQASCLVCFLTAAWEKGSGKEKGAPLLPDWAANLLAEDSRQAVWDAFAAAQRLAGGRKRFFTFPLLSPRESSPVIIGRSLGLPLALAALAAASPPTGEREEWRWLATGDIDSAGAVRPVNDDTLSAKARMAFESRCHLFLCPAGNQPPGLFSIKIKPVADLKQAWLWVDRGAAGQGQEVQTLETALASAQGFVDICASLSVQSLAYCRNDPAFQALKKTLLDPQEAGLFRKMTRQLEKLLSGETADIPKAAELAQTIASKEELQAVGETDPVSAFAWCSCCIALANHRGNNGETKRWRRIAEPFKEKARKGDPQSYSRFVNRFYVGDRHNRYDFSPELPEEFSEILREEERHHRGGLNYTLGALYGTLAQNYGFCGPDYLPELIAFTGKSQAAFGDGEFPEHSNDYRRGFSYLVAAYMDQGCRDEARAALWNYLGADSWGAFLKALKSGDSPFAEYMLCRYLAEFHDEAAPEPGTIPLVDRVLSDGDLSPHSTDHPWQLWNYNAGRLALRCGASERAAAFWGKSLKLCDPRENPKAGETVNAMALLPLAALWQNRLLSQSHREKTRGVMEILKNSKVLNQKHFVPLTAADHEDTVLRLVAEDPKRYFPFTYR